MKKGIIFFINKFYKLILKIHIINVVKIKNGVQIDYKSSFCGKNILYNNVVFKNSKLGYASYVGNDSYIYNTLIGKYTCIGPYVKCIIGQHPLNFVSIHPCFYSTMKQAGFTYVDKNKFNEFEYIDEKNKKSIIIGNDVWICADVKILEGVTINDGAVVLPGAVVNNDVPPYAIVGGVPAKIIKYRFSQEDINFLMNLKWWNKDENWIIKNHNNFDNISKMNGRF